MKEWIVRLRGLPTQLQDLAKVFKSGNILIYENKENFYLKSPVLNGFLSVHDVLPIAYNLVELLNNALFLYFENFDTIEFASLVRMNDDGSHQNHIFLSSKATAKSRTGLAILTLIDENGNTIPDTTPHEITTILDILTQYPNVADALHFFRECDWVNLYKVYEVVRDDLTEAVIIQQGWATKKQLGRFTQTAQSRDTLGDKARHASRKYKPHLEPMSLSEAKGLIKHLLIHWVQSKRLT